MPSEAIPKCFQPTGTILNLLVVNSYVNVHVIRVRDRSMTTIPTVV